jgi:hypothetical protein
MLSDAGLGNACQYPRIMAWSRMRLVCFIDNLGAASTMHGVGRGALSTWLGSQKPLCLIVWGV